MHDLFKILAGVIAASAIACFVRFLEWGFDRYVFKFKSDMK